MKMKELENYIEFLFSVALQKCGDTYDAEDLTQEVLLAALSYTASGREIQDMRAWMTTVLTRKFNDMLRKRYRQASVSIGENFDIIDENAYIELNCEDDEAENVRKALAYLTKIYREVIVRYYMNGQSIARIASELNIPEGTVKSRLYLGRNYVKKGMSDMEKYTKQSYAPIKLNIAYSGASGLNDEPLSLVENDLIAQNVLWCAYRKPITEEEIGLSLGIPLAYLEPIVQKLVDGELMRKVGNKYYTDFMIATLEDREKYISAQKQCVHENFEQFWNAIETALVKLRQYDFYERCVVDAKNSFELYVAFHCLDYGLYTVFSEIFHAKQDFKERPNAGRWIAFGNVHFNEFNGNEHRELLAHSYSGERIARLDKFGDSKHFELHIYGADGFPSYRYDRSPEYTFLPEKILEDSEIAKLLYIMESGMKPENVGFNHEYLRAIPWLTKCKIFREEEGKPVANIPILKAEEGAVVWNICREARSIMTKELKDILGEFLQGKKLEIPAHLDSVPLQKQYMYANNAMIFAVIREAISRGKLYDGKYDDTSHGVNQVPCPMVFVIE